MTRRKKTPPPDQPETVIQEPFDEALAGRYLAYAVSTITARALPDVRDGLKPVHRRILYAMRQMKLSPGGRFKKSAKVVGEVMGNFHPHGDQAIYDAMVRLVQDFSVRVPLVDGQGNFGNIDGDNAAAMRYTESRLTAAAQLLLEGIDEDAVDFRETYDGEGREPVVFPAAFPNLLANGASGIAVGMATSIPPHNVSELIDACLYLVGSPGARIQTLMKYIKGPDFPTGGVCVESPSSMEEAYTTGRGGFRVRAKWHAEKLPRGGYRIIVTEIPYQVQKSRLIEKIADLIQSKKLLSVSDIRDESAEDIRLVLEPRSANIDETVLMENVFRLTELEQRFPLNMNVLDASGVPRLTGLREVLQSYLDHRKEVIARRARYRLEKADARLLVLDGFLVAYLNLDEVIRIIRYEDAPAPVLMETFGLSGEQADAILNMRLRSLRRLEEKEIKTEYEKLRTERRDLRRLLGDEKLQWKKTADELRRVRKLFDPDSPAGQRCSTFGTAPESVSVDDSIFMEKEPVTVLLSRKGWIRTMKGHLEDRASVKYREGDEEEFVIRAMSTDRVVLFSTGGKFYTLDVASLPGGRGYGEPVRLMLDFGAADSVLAAFLYQGSRKFLVASTSAHGFLVHEAACLSNTRKGKQVLNLSPGAEAVVCRPAYGDMLATVGSNRKMLICSVDGLPEMVRGKGVVLQKIREGCLVDAKVFFSGDGFRWVDSSGRIRKMDEWEACTGRRAQAGRLVPKGFPRSGRFGKDI